MGGLIPRARYKFEGNIAAKHRASEVEIHPGALPTSPPANLSRTYALPAYTTAMESNQKNRPKRTAVRASPSALRHASIGAWPRPGQLRRSYRPAFPGASSIRWRSPAAGVGRWSSGPRIGPLIGGERALHATAGRVWESVESRQRGSNIRTVARAFARGQAK
jgi:hypothetical protein